jgi:transcriptional repressor NrdR
MKCPFCGYMDDKVIDSRLGKDGDIIRRRRECLKCERRFTTYERVEDVLPMVVKKDGRREPFDRNKILLGIKKACEKRPISVQAVENVVTAIEASFSETSDREIKSTEIGEKVMTRLRDLDDVAYVRFASVYRSFKDINEFMSELKDILDRRDNTKG